MTFRGLPFPGIQQEVILLLARRGSSTKGGIELLELDDAVDLQTRTSSSFGAKGFKSIDHGAEKWTQYYLSQEEINLLRTLRNDVRLTKFGSLGDTDVGIVTGMNDVFVLSKEEVAENELAAFTRPIVSRSAHLAGTIFKKADWKENVSSGYKAFLLDIPPVERHELPRNLVNYLRKAEALGLHQGYKCRVRKRWYVVPSVYVPDAFMLRQIHHYPKLVVNGSLATCTDTIHRVRFKNKTDPATLAAAFLNSLTFAFAEILGRSYGGGVLELEPNEADLLPIPLLNADELDPKKIDWLVRSSRIDEVLRIKNPTLLATWFSLPQHHTQIL